MILNKNNLQITQILILNKITYITFMINITIYKNILYDRYKFPSYKIRYIKINTTDNVNNNEKYRSHCRTGSLFCLLPYNYME